MDVIVSNPPYISINQLKKTLKNLKYEPIISLYSKKNGLYDFSKIIYNSKKYLKRRGFLFLEHGSDQGKDIRKILFKYNYENIRTVKDFNYRDRVTMAINK
jgi:release factor glutamine methyltransferase